MELEGEAAREIRKGRGQESREKGGKGKSDGNGDREGRGGERVGRARAEGERQVTTKQALARLDRAPEKSK